ncbi:MAG: hypothetical protein ACHQRM_09620 [Bacteroidia bacterium]
MKSLPLSALFLFLSLHSPAQQFKKVYYKSDSVFIYPFPFYCWNYYENPFCETSTGGSKSDADGLFVTSTPLPAGKWIAYYNDPKKYYVAGNKSVSGPKKNIPVALCFTAAEGKMNGPAVLYSRAGKKLGEGNYKDGEKDGVWNIYSFNGKELVEKLEYRNGLAHGTWESYKHGKVKTRNHFKEGLMDGEQTEYNKGKISSVTHMLKDKPDGDVLGYWSDGSLESKTTYRDGRKTGWHREWADGKLLQETHYYNGSDTLWEGGVEKFNRRTGMNYREIPDWIKDGPSAKWWPNGQLMQKEYYKLGKQVYGDTDYFSNGHIEYISYDSAGVNPKIKLKVTRQYMESGHLKSLNLRWKDSLSVERTFDKNGILEHEAIEIPKMDTLYVSNTLNTPAIRVEQHWFRIRSSYFVDGILRNEDLSNPFTRVSREFIFNKKGFLTYSSTDSGSGRQVFNYTRNGIIKKKKYSSAVSRHDIYAYGHHPDNGSSNFEKRIGTDSTVIFHKGKGVNASFRKKLYSTAYCKGMLKEGRMQGHWVQYDKGHWIQTWGDHRRHYIPKHKSAEADFISNKKEGTEYTYDLYTPWKYERHNHASWYKSEKMEFVHDKAHGTRITYYCDGKIKSRSNYEQGELHGLETTYHGNGVIEDSIPYIHGQKHGMARTRYSNGMLLKEESFIAGIEEGIYKSYYYNGIKEEEGTYKEGVKTGAWAHYFKAGTENVKAEFLTDETVATLKLKAIPLPPDKLKTDKHDKFRNENDPVKVYGQPETDYEINNAHITYFYENKTKAQEGYVVEGRRVGNWTWWREDGSIEKEVDYTPGRYRTSGNDSITYIGHYTSWYASGKKALEALIMDEDQKYDCRKEVTDKIQNLYYLHGWDESEQPVITNGNGYFKGKKQGGLVQSEGPLEKGLKNGFWQYRDENGNVNSMGAYKDGLQEGLWMEGDLAGIHSIENACYRNMTQEEMDRLLEKLAVTELWYKDGELLKTVKHKNEVQHFYRKERFHPFREHKHTIFSGVYPSYSGFRYYYSDY